MLLSMDMKKVHICIIKLQLFNDNFLYFRVVFRHQLCGGEARQSNLQPGSIVLLCTVYIYTLGTVQCTTRQHCTALYCSHIHSRHSLVYNQVVLYCSVLFKYKNQVQSSLQPGSIVLLCTIHIYTLGTVQSTNRQYYIALY